MQEHVARTRKPHNRDFLHCLLSCAAVCHQPHFCYVGFDHQRKANGSDARGHTWINDSGCTIHICNDASRFKTMRTHGQMPIIRVANGKTVAASGVGSIVLRLRNQHGKYERLILDDVAFIPEMSQSLLSPKRLWKTHRIKTKFGDACEFKALNGSRFTFPRNDDDYLIQTEVAAYAHECVFSASPTTEPASSLLHRRLAHFGHARLRAAGLRSVGLPSLKNYLDHPFCDSCAKGSHVHVPFTKKKPRKYSYFGQLIHSDVCSGFPPSVVHGYEYMVNFVDAATGFVAIYFTKDKTADSIIECVKQFIEDHKHLLPNGTVECWRTDCGGEFTAHSVDEFCHEFAIRRGFSIPYIPQQNGRAERAWRTVLRPMRTIFAESKLPLELWPFAARQVADIHNRLPSHSAPGMCSPWEAVHHEKPDLSMYRVWGCKAFYRLPDVQHDSKLDPPSVDAVYLGQDKRYKGYLLYVPHLNRIVPSWHVLFNENDFNHDFSGIKNISWTVSNKGLDFDEGVASLPPLPYSGSDGMPASPVIPTPNNNLGNFTATGDPINPGYVHGDTTSWRSDHCSHPDCTLGKHSDDVPHSFEQVSGRRIRRAMRVQRTASDRKHCSALRSTFGKSACSDPCNVFAVAISNGGLQMCYKVNEKCGINIPNTIEEAKASKQWPLWKAAMDKEVSELLGNGTWADVSDPTNHIPRDRKATRSRWVFDIKQRRDGSIERYKARFVACGYSQTQGIDYDRAFSATMRSTSFRTLLSLAAVHNLRLDSLDVSNAFVQADIGDVDIWVQPPPGYETFDASNLPVPVKLIKSLYGTKQASRCWQDELCKALESQGFVRNDADPCLFVKRIGNKVILLGCYVDDLLVAYSDRGMFNEFKTAFLQRFKAKHLGPTKYYLGIAVDQDADFSVSIHQSKAIDDLFSRFIDVRKFTKGVPNFHTPSVPDRLAKLGKSVTAADLEAGKRLPYLQLIGSLLYIATCTRADVLYEVAFLARFMSAPTAEAYECALHVLIYLHNTRHYRIRYSSEIMVPQCLAEHGTSMQSNFGLHAFTDASWLVESVGGYAIFMGNGLVSFSSKKIHISCQSSAEAEYASAALVVRELAFIRNLLYCLDVPLSQPTLLAFDSEAAIAIALDKGCTARNKHLELYLHNVRYACDHRRILPAWVSKDVQAADILTKSNSPEDFKLHFPLLRYDTRYGGV